MWSACLAHGALTGSASCRWKGGNGPEQTDYVAVGNLIRATPKNIQRFVLTTSAGCATAQPNFQQPCAS